MHRYFPFSTHVISPCSIVGSSHPSLSCGEGFGGVKREARDITDAPYLPISILRLERMGCILNHSQLVSLSKVTNLIHFTRIPAEMHGHNGFGAAGYGAVKGRWKAMTPLK